MIYLDYAAATPLDQTVLKKMLPYLNENYGNPSSIYGFAQTARRALDDARLMIAKNLNCTPKEIFFTGSGTEANNWAIFGTVKAQGKKKIITTSIEHHSVLHPAQELERLGYAVVYLKPNKDGRISLEDLEENLTKDTALVSVMYANNEIGTIENITKIGNLARGKGVLFHTDACQAAGFLPLDVEKLSVDLMTINSGKIYGPKGVGALYVRKGVKICPLLYGGGQEYRSRAGTENVAGIVGFAHALNVSEQKRAKEAKRLTLLRNLLTKELSAKIPDLKINGDPKNRLPNNVNISFKDVDGESLIMRLDMAGICASSGSACSSGSLEPSHVLLGIGLSKEQAKSSLRITLGRYTTGKEIKAVISVLPKIIKSLRE